MQTPLRSITHSQLRAFSWRRRGTPLLTSFSVIACIVLTAASLDPQMNPDKPIHAPVLTQFPDKNAQMTMQMNKQTKDDYEAANAERRKQLVDDSTKLLVLATQLKTEVDKTNKDTLSINVIKKAAEIEKLAHDVRIKMRLVVGGM